MYLRILLQFKDIKYFKMKYNFYATIFSSFLITFSYFNLIYHFVYQICKKFTTNIGMNENLCILII